MLLLPAVVACGRQMDVSNLQARGSFITIYEPEKLATILFYALIPFACSRARILPEEKRRRKKT